ncbi:MAG TPA: ankyrin repeat domain-containing protein [Gammaproteobacteria bacterium]|nr:ankyrin repeat domain-containing protein [Gammaproteobacteria bacterium]
MATNTTQDDLSYSPATKLLIYAVHNNRPNVAKSSIRMGANVNARVANGDSLLHICPNEDIGAILINHGANVNSRNPNDETPLHTSMRRGLIPLSTLLIDSSSDVNAQDQTGTAPLHLAESDEVNATLLLQNANVNVQDNAGDTPLHLAIRIKGSPMVIALVDAGADKNIRNNAGHNAYDEVMALIARRESELGKVSNAIFVQPVVTRVVQEAADLKEKFRQAEDSLSALVDAPLQKLESAFPAFHLSKQSNKALHTPSAVSLNPIKYTPKLTRN